VTERIASPEAGRNHMNEIVGSNMACKEEFGGQEELNKEN
jgi:hypothetical protein